MKQGRIKETETELKGELEFKIKLDSTERKKKLK